jgi:hypothetical protein
MWVVAVVWGLWQGSGGLWSSCCSQGTATGARGWLGAVWGESLELPLPDSDLVWSKEGIRCGLGWWRVMRPMRSRSAAIGVQVTLLEVGLGFWRSEALEGCMGPAASFYWTCFRSRQDGYWVRS